SRVVGRPGGVGAAGTAGPGGGSELVVRLPIAAPAAAASAEPVLADDGKFSRVRRILIVEDNGDAREMLREALLLAGHFVEAAPDGGTALSVVGTFHPDVVLVDIGLPDMNGYEVAVAMPDRLAGIPAIPPSGYGHMEDGQGSREAGCVATLVNPVAVDDLQRALEKLPR